MSTAITYNKALLIQKFFGYQPAYFPPVPPKPAGNLNRDNSPGADSVESFDYKNEAKRLSYLGTPVYDQLQLMENGEVKYTFPDNTIIEVTCPKIIVRTQLNKRRGSVKEYINHGDCVVTIRGLIINYDSYDYPEEAVSRLYSFFELGRAWDVAGMALNNLGIFRLVMRDLKLNRQEGIPGVQPFIITAEEDLDIILEDYEL